MSDIFTEMDIALKAEAPMGKPRRQPNMIEKVWLRGFGRVDESIAKIMEFVRDVTQWRAESNARIKRLEEDNVSLRDRLHRLENKGRDE